MDDYLDKVKKKRLEDKAKLDREEELGTVKGGSDAVVHAIAQEGARSRTNTQKVKVENDNLAQTKDVQEVVDSINRLNVTTFLASKDNWTQVVGDMAAAAERIQSVIKGLESSGIKKIEDSFSSAVASLQNVVSQIKKVKLEQDGDVKQSLKQIAQAISSIEVNPVVNVPDQQVVVNEKEVDLTPLVGLLEGIQGQLEKNRVEIPKNDYSKLESAVEGVKKSIDSLRFPVSNYILPFKDVNGKAVQVQLDGSGNLPISATISGADGAITDGASASIKATVFDLTNSNPLATQIVDANGDAISSFGGGTQYTEDAAAAANPVGNALNLVSINTPASSVSDEGDNVAARGTMKGELYVKHVDSIAVTNAGLTELAAAINASSQMDVNIAANGIGLATSAKQDTIIGHVDGLEGLLTTIDGDTGNISTKIDTLAGAVSGTEVQVDVLTMPTVTVDSELTTADLDTGAGTDTRAVVGLVGAKSGGAALIPGDATAGLKVDLGADNDVTVTGSVTANAGTNLNTSALALESGGNLAAAATSLAALDNSVDGNYLNVNMNVAGTDVVSGSGNATGALRVELPTNGTGVIATVGAVTAITNALPAGTNAIGKLAANSGVDIGDVDVTSISAGSNLIGDVGLSGARTAGGTTPYKNIDVDETEDEVKGSAGQVYWIHAINTTAAPLYLKFYNATAANVTVGSTTPVLTLPVPGNADSDGAGFTLSIPNGIAFGTAITIAATTAVADNDTGAPGANALIVNLGYA